MSTILIDRRTAALLGELAAAPARPQARALTAVDGVALGVTGSGSARAAGRRTPQRIKRRPAATTRRPARRLPENLEAQPVVTVRRPAEAEVRLRRRLRCEPGSIRRRTGVARPVATVRGGSAARHTRGLHLTRRGRLVALLLLLAVLTVAFSVGRVTSTALGAAGGSSAEVVVHRGDTLWSIAERIAPNSDPRSTAADLMAVNGLGSPSLQVGQHLRLP